MTAPARAPWCDRTHWTADKLLSRSGMDGRRQVERPEDAILVSSLCSSGKHAPVLDFDFATWGMNGSRRRSPPPRCLRHHVDENVCGCDGRGGRLPVETNWLIVGTRGTWSQPSIAKVRAALVAAGLATDAEQNGVDAFELQAPVRFVPSSTAGHWHVYIDQEITWAQYVPILEAMRDAGLLQRGFANNSIDREMTMALTVTKAQLVERGVEIETYRGADQEGTEAATDATEPAQVDGALDGLLDDDVGF